MEGLLKASAFNFGRMLFGDGSGTLGKVTAITSGVITLDSVKNVIEGMVVDFRTSGGEAISGADGRRILAVDRKNKKITVSGTTLTTDTVAANSIVTVQGSYNNEITGLKAIFSDSGSIYGLSRSTHSWLIPYIKTSAGSVSEVMIQTAIDEIEAQSGGNVDLIVCSWGVRRALQALFATNRRAIDVVELAGGYKAMSYNGIPIVADRFCPDGTMYLLNTADFTLHQLCDWQWLEGDDGKVLKQVAGKPVYSATLVKYADLICARPNGQGMISGITEA
jgi:rhodanese-related sulfurtransferase